MRKDGKLICDMKSQNVELQVISSANRTKSIVLRFPVEPSDVMKRVR
jgi:hypothetical protein